MALFRRGAAAEDPAAEDEVAVEGQQPAQEEPGTKEPPGTKKGLEVEVAEPELRPSRMRGTEPLYGYVVGLELLVVAIIQIIVRGGKGAPAHPQTSLQIVAIVASLAFFGVLQLRNRTIVGFAAIVAAFFVTLPRVPNSLGVAHILSLIVPLAYGLIITQRQRKAMVGAARSGRGGGRGAARAGGGTRREAGGGAAAGRRPDRRRGKAQPEPSGPRPSARYTPPKSKRSNGKGKGKVAGR